MALLLSLSLLWAFTVYPDVGDSAASDWTLRLEYCASNKTHFTLEIVMQNCSSTFSSETCVNTDYKWSKSINFSLMARNGSIKLYENNTGCDKSNTQPELHPKIIFKNQTINSTQGKNELILWTSENHTKVKINFKCVDNSLNLVLQNTNKSWIDALEDCQKNHSSLVQISTDAVMDKVKYLLQNCTRLQTRVWIGLERSVFGYNTEWKWISGSRFEDSKLNQSVSAKNNSNNHCGMIVYENNEIQWQAAYCHENLPFICQSPVWNVSPCTSNMAAENSELSIDIIEESGSSSNEECK